MITRATPKSLAGEKLFTLVRLTLVAAVQEIGVVLIGSRVQPVRDNHLVIVDGCCLEESNVRGERVALIKQSIQVRHIAVEV